MYIIFNKEIKMAFIRNENKLIFRKNKLLTFWAM